MTQEPEGARKNGTVCVLVVSAEPPALEALTGHLRDAGVTVTAFLGPEAVFAMVGEHRWDDALLSLPFSTAKELTTKAFEQRYLTAMLAQAGGSISAAARLAKLDRSNFRRLLRHHGLHHGATGDQRSQVDAAQPQRQMQGRAAQPTRGESATALQPGSASPRAAATRRA